MNSGLIQDKLLPFLLKVGSNRYMIAIKDGITLTVPLTIVGSIFLIIGNLPIKAWTDFIAPYSSIIGAPVAITFGVLGLVAAIGMGYTFANTFKLHTISNTIMTFTAFLLATLNDEWGIDVSNFDAKGMFTAIIIAIFVMNVHRFFVVRNIVIKMPEGVPPAVADSFASLLPLTFIVIIVWFVRVVLGVNINEIVRMVFSPLVVGLGTLPGVWITTFLVQFLWICGIHGGHTLAGLTSPIALQFLAENSAAFQNNAPIPHVNPEGFWVLFQSVGGTGATLGLVIAMLFSKSVLYKSLGKLSIGPALFCINEPVIFGFPIVMNPVMMIPFILTPLVLGTATYLLMDFGLIGKIVHNVPWTIPPIIGPYLATNGNIYAAIWSLVSIIISCVMYYPFFKIEEKKQLEVELNNATKS